MRRHGFRSAAAERRSGIYLRRHLQRYPALYFHQYQVRLFLYHADHRILYDEAGRGRASREIATGRGPHEAYYRKGE